MRNMKHSTISIGLLLLSCIVFYTACKKDQNTLSEELSNGNWRVYSMLDGGVEWVSSANKKYHFSLSAINDVDLEGVFVFEYGPEPYIDRDTLSISVNAKDSTLGISPCLPWVFACSQPNVMKIRRLSQDTLIFDGTDELGGYAIIKAVRE